MDHTQATIVGTQCFRSGMHGNCRLRRFGFFASGRESQVGLVRVF